MDQEEMLRLFEVHREAEAARDWEVEEHGDVEIEIGGVRLAREDWILADADGIVAIPAAVAADVVTEAEEKVATESEIRGAVRAGTTPLDAYERYGTS